MANKQELAIRKMQTFLTKEAPNLKHGSNFSDFTLVGLVSQKALLKNISLMEGNVVSMYNMYMQHRMRDTAIC